MNFFWIQEDLINGEDVATCPSCSLLLKVIYDPEQFAAEETEEVAVITQNLTKVSLTNN